MLKAKIIVLKAIKYSEADLLIQSIDSHGNRLHFLAKGALKSKKRFGGGVLEPTHYLDVLYKEGRGSFESDPLHILLEAKVLRDFPKLRDDYDRLMASLSFLSLVNKLTRSGSVGAKEIFDLLGHGLSACESCEDTRSLKLQFQAKLLYSQGVLEPMDDLAPLLGISLKDSAKLKIPKKDLGVLESHLDLATREMLNL